MTSRIGRPGGDPLRLGEGVDGEAACTLEPAFVAGTCERLEEGDAVPRGAVAESVALLVAVGAGLPDELGGGEQEIRVEILPGAGDDTGRAGAQLETDPTVSWPCELRTRHAGPVREAVLAERVSRQNLGALTRDGIVRLETEQSERVSRDAVERAEAAVVVVLPPQPVVAAALPEGSGRLAGSRMPPVLLRPFAHRQSGEKRAGRSPADVIGRVVDVPANERVHVVRERRVKGQPEGD
jgi:hypothetical protein